MIGDLPELDDFFNSNTTVKKRNDKLEQGLIYIYLSKDDQNWILTDFIDLAVAGIGIHISVPIKTDLTAEEMNNIKIRFVKKESEFENILKELKMLVRWQEKDKISGNIKLGLHFLSEDKNNSTLNNILKELR